MNWKYFNIFPSIRLRVLVINSLLLIKCDWCAIGDLGDKNEMKWLPLLKPILNNGVYRNDASAHIRCIPATIFHIFLLFYYYSSVSTPISFRLAMRSLTCSQLTCDAFHELINIWSIGRYICAPQWKHQTCVDFWWYSIRSCLFARLEVGERGRKSMIIIWGWNKLLSTKMDWPMDSIECFFCH